MFSNEILTLEEIARYYKLWKQSLEYYMDAIVSQKVYIHSEFLSYTIKELRDEFNKLKCEVEKCAVLNILTAIEAEFRVDFITRVQERYKCSISKKFRKLYKENYRQKRFHEIPLKEVILKIWKEEFPKLKRVIDPYSEALKYRHWLCHGRWWEPKVKYDEKFDFDTVYTIAVNIYNNIPFSKKIK